MIYILLIIGSVYGGWVPNTQEFNSKDSCELAAVWYEHYSGYIHEVHAQCVPK